jgi:hypothetical protein
MTVVGVVLAIVVAALCVEAAAMRESVGRGKPQRQSGAAKGEGALEH